MAVQSRAALKSDKNTAFADNTAGDISAADLRGEFEDVIDSVYIPGDDNTGDNLLMTSAERTKLTGVATGATANSGALADLNTVNTAQIDDDAVTISKLSATGTASSSTFLRGDNTWAAPTGGGGGDLLASNNLSDVASAATSRTNLGLTIGTDVQAYSAVLAATTASFTTADETKLDNISEVADPLVDSIGFFDVSFGDMVYFTSMTGLSISGTTLSVSVDTAQIVDGAVTIAKIDATGTPGSGNFLRGDGQWVAPAGGGDLLAANNLSDLANAGTARTNLGLGTAATTASTAYATSAQGDVAETEVVTVCLFEAGEDTATGNKAGNQVFRVPAKLNGWNLTGVAAYVDTAGTTGTTDVQIHNITDTVDMLTTVITIDSAETDSSTAATAAVIDAANDDVATGDKIRFDVDAVSTTAAQGLWVEMTFEAP